MTITNLHYQRAKPSPLWYRRFPGIRIGRGLARIARVLWGKAPCGAGPARPRLARRVVAPHGRGRWWRERPPGFCRWCSTGQEEVVQAKIHHHPSPFRGVAPTTMIPAGRPWQWPTRGSLKRWQEALFAADELFAARISSPHTRRAYACGFGAFSRGATRSTLSSAKSRPARLAVSLAIATTAFPPTEARHQP